MVKPERRTRADIVVALAIAAVIVVTAAAIWWTSDARATVSRPAVDVSKSVPPARDVPATLTELWRAPSQATTVPVVASGSVITGTGRTVEGRDPITGDARWSFARDLDLCGVSWVYQYAVAVYPDVRGCGQVSTVDAATGKRGASRSGYADNTVTLTSDGTTVLAAGSTRLELWRSDMVRVIGYGEVDARVKPSQTGVGKGCALLSAAASPSAVSVLRSCGGEADVRLTLLRPGKDDDEPELRDVPEPGVSATSGARVLAVSGTTTAVYLPKPGPRVSIVDETGTELFSTPLPAPATSADEPGTVSRAGDLITWWTGDSVMAFSADKLTHRYTVPFAAPSFPVGPATKMADKLLIPVTGGIGVYNMDTGASERLIPVNRPSIDSGVAVVVPAVIGATVLEQRGANLVALGSTN
jgi:hypothetical protein